MMNVNILNKLIEGISKQIPLVNSFYTKSPYESWNVRECKYGSVSFVVTKVNTRESNTTYDAIIYYGDRMLEDFSNRDSIFSDAATVIQTIVGALNTADEYLEVSYPVSITLFEQSFEESLAGGYANISISTEGMGECFDGEFTIPDIIGTSAYYTKDEITELFPLRSQLSTVAYTGDYNDLINIPDFVPLKSFSDFAEGQNKINESFASEMAGKVSLKYFGDTIDQLETDINNRLDAKVDDSAYEAKMSQIDTDLNDKASKQTVNQLDNKISKAESSLDSKIDNVSSTLSESINNINNTIDAKVDGKVDKSTFEAFKNTNNAELNNKASKQELAQTNNKVSDLEDDLSNKVNISSYEGLAEGVNTSLVNLAKELSNKVSISYFEDYKDEIKGEVEKKVDKSTFESFKDSTETELSGKVSAQDLAQTNNKVSDLEDDLSNKVNLSSYEGLAEGVNTSLVNLANVITTKVDSGYFESWKTLADNKINEKVDKSTFESFKDNTNTQLSNKVTKQELAQTNNKVSDLEDDISVLEDSLSDKVDTTTFNSFKTSNSTELDSKVSKQDLEKVNGVVTNIKEELSSKVDYSAYADHVEEVDEAIATLTESIDNKLDTDYFDGWSEGIEDELSERVTRQSFDNFAVNVYTKTETEDLISTKVDRVLNAYVESDDFKEYVENTVHDSVIDITSDIINDEEFISSLETKVDEIVGDKIGEFVTQSELEGAVDSAVGEAVESVIGPAVDSAVGEAVEPVVDTKISEHLSDYYTKTEIDTKLDELEVDVDLSDYYNKTEIDTKLDELEVDVDLGDYYNKTEIDTKLDELEVDVDLGDYYTKTEIDAVLGDINSILYSVLYEA